MKVEVECWFCHKKFEAEIKEVIGVKCPYCGQVNFVPPLPL
ncbi:MAG: hypothetical protein ACXQTI_08755 [Candidatus Nezhaarchaeales archaeon]